MTGSGRLNILIGADTRYCADCGAPEMDVGCSNSACWRARPNARFPISLALEQLAVEINFPSGTEREGLFHGWFHHYFHLLSKAMSHHGQHGYGHATSIAHHV